MGDYTLFGNSSLPEELDSRVRGELERGEQLLWVGQPRPSRFARASIPMVLFGIPWTAFAVFWVAMASGAMFMGAPGGIGGFFACFPLFGLPFVAIGIGMLSSPYWMRRKARRTCYALTDRRAILWEAGTFGSVEVRSYRPAELNRICRTEHADGNGDLVFEEIVTVGTDSDGHRTTNTKRRGFLCIDDVRSVEELLRKALLTESDKT
jgi:hypothetical protein